MEDDEGTTPLDLLARTSLFEQAVARTLKVEVLGVEVADSKGSVQNSSMVTHLRRNGHVNPVWFGPDKSL